jgi:hypothetical protein
MATGFAADVWMLGVPSFEDKTPMITVTGGA